MPYPPEPFPEFTPPMPQTISSGTLTFGCNHAEEFKLLNERMVRIEAGLSRVEAGMAIREAMEELLRKLGEFDGTKR